MDPMDKTPPPPVLAYSDKPPPRPGNLPLANTIAIAGMILWVLGIPTALLGALALAVAITSGEAGSLTRLGAIAISAGILVAGVCVCILAHLLTRRVHRIASGG